MPFIHKQLGAGRWYKLSFMEQMANIGAEIGRALKWQAKREDKLSQKALERGLELFDLTVADPRLRHRLKEILRMREIVCDYFVGGNKYNSTPESLEKYFLTFTIPLRR